MQFLKCVNTQRSKPFKTWTQKSVKTIHCIIKFQQLNIIPFYDEIVLYLANKLCKDTVFETKVVNIQHSETSGARDPCCRQTFTQNQTLEQALNP